jgi:hypothetical protein
MDESSVRVSFPATADFMRLARLAAADAGSRAGLDFEEIDDLRIAVNELCVMLAGSDSETMMTLDFVPAPSGLVVTGSAPHAGALAVGELSSAIIDAVADEHQIGTQDGIGRFRVVKHARTAR